MKWVLRTLHYGTIYVFHQIYFSITVYQLKYFRICFDFWGGLLEKMQNVKRSFSCNVPTVTSHLKSINLSLKLPSIFDLGKEIPNGNFFPLGLWTPINRCVQPIETNIVLDIIRIFFFYYSPCSSCLSYSSFILVILFWSRILVNLLRGRVP